MQRSLGIFLIGAAAVLAGCATPGTAAPPGGWGRYSGTIQVEWQPGRKMRLLRDSHYVSPEGVDWLAPKGWDIDGASIPKAFWCTIGGPYEDFYRDASVFHDVACDQRKARWQDVHKMFYTAMRCSGVTEEKANIMYAAVYRFGPRWPDPTLLGGRAPNLAAAREMTPRQPTASEAKEIENWVKNNHPSLKQIETTTAIPGRPAQ